MTFNKTVDRIVVKTIKEYKEDLAWGRIEMDDVVEMVYEELMITQVDLLDSHDEMIKVIIDKVDNEICKI